MTILFKKNTKIKCSDHAIDQMKNRGYSNSDVESCLNYPYLRIVEERKGFSHFLQRMCPTYTIEGVDADGKPLALVLSKESDQIYNIITIMPPTDGRRFYNLICYPTEVSV